MSANNPWDKKEKERKAKEKAEKEAKLKAEREAREKEEAEKEASKANEEVAGTVEELETPEVTDKPSLSVVQPSSKSKSKKTRKAPFEKDKGAKKPPKEPIHIFFDPDVLEVLKAKQAEKEANKERGWKSNYVNDLVRWAFEQEGWIDPEE